MLSRVLRVAVPAAAAALLYKVYGDMNSPALFFAQMATAAAVTEGIDLAWGPLSRKAVSVVYGVVLAVIMAASKLIFR